ncbi:hypothetical protein C5167_031134 [Papaver somniferum]|nr:hypothetical protein C5167_031134 [Papaver somniferum]
MGGASSFIGGGSHEMLISGQKRGFPFSGRGGFAPSHDIAYTDYYNRVYVEYSFFESLLISLQITLMITLMVLRSYLSSGSVPRNVTEEESITDIRQPPQASPPPPPAPALPLQAPDNRHHKNAQHGPKQTQSKKHVALQVWPALKDISDLNGDIVTQNWGRSYDSGLRQKNSS